MINILCVLPKLRDLSIQKFSLSCLQPARSIFYMVKQLTWLITKPRYNKFTSYKTLRFEKIHHCLNLFKVLYIMPDNAHVLP